VLRITGAEHITPDRDPFILALNHSTRLEALIVPVLLLLLRGGRRVHFLADWNFMLVPGVGLLYRRSGTIVLGRKPARPRFLNALRPYFTDATPPMEQARARLLNGDPIGIYPEGTTNRNPKQLMRGRLGAARLSLETDVPIVPAGLCFPGIPRGERVPEGSPFEIRFGAPLVPPRAIPNADAPVVEWHLRIMAAIASQSGKQQSSYARERHSCEA
jgi:1-acyl-sn-glycerol-3-phosphate acyltransferase